MVEWFICLVTSLDTDQLGMIVCYFILSHTHQVSGATPELPINHRSYGYSLHDSKVRKNDAPALS